MKSIVARFLFFLMLFSVVFSLLILSRTEDQGAAEHMHRDCLILEGGLLVLTVAVVTIFQILVSRRLRKLTNHLKNTLPGESALPQLPITGHDEISMVGMAFNGLLDQLNASQRSLETKVIERTAELERANTQLQIQAQERAKVEKSLRESEELFRRIFEEGAMGMAIQDAHFRFTSANAAFCRMVGYTEDELSRLTFKDITHPDHLDENVGGVERLTRGEIPVYRTRKRYIRKDGKTVWTNVTSSILRDQNGEFLNYFAMIEDITEQKRAEQNYQTLFREMLDGFALHEVIFDESGRPCDYRFLAVNPAFERLTGLQAQALLGKTVLDVMPDTEPYWIEAYGKVALTGEPAFFENYSRELGKYYEVTAFRTGSNKFACIFADVTQRKRAEEAIKESEHLFRELFENMNSGVAIYEACDDGADFIIKDMNKAGEAFSYVKREDIIGKRLLATFPGVREIGLMDVFQRVWRTGNPEHHPAILYQDARISEWVENYVLKMATGNLIAIYDDITEAKLAEQEIRKFKSITDAANYGVVIMDLDGTISYINRYFAQLHGWSVEEVIGKHWRIGFPPEQHEKAAKAIAGLFKLRKPSFVELSHRHKNGGTFPTLMSGCLVRNDSGDPLFVAATAIDMTEHKQLENQLRQSQKMEAVGQLAGGVAHDFNNLLQVILGNSEILQADISGTHPGNSELMEIIKAADRASMLVRQLLVFSRRQSIDRQNISLNTIVTDWLKMLRRVIGEHIDLQFHPSDNIDLVCVDPGQIELVLMNLCVNSRDAMPEGGKITIATEPAVLDKEYCKGHPWAREGQYVLLSVADTGPGIELDMQERIFEPFFTTKDIGKGTGLGLSTVYGIVKQHDGIIHLYSEVGHGTVVKVYLPIASKAEQTPHVTTHQPLPLKGTETILLAEDEGAVRQLASTILTKHGYKVIVAKDGQEAMDLFVAHQNEIQGMLLDVVMPKASGKQVYDYIKPLKPEMPVLFSSGYSRDILEAGLAPNEQCEVIQKPYNARDLLTRLRNILDSRNQK